MTDSSLYQLELVVKSVTWCGRPDDGKCGATVGVRFLDNAEQTVCKIPAAAVDSDGAAATVLVNAGKTFTFAVPPGGCPKPVRVAVRLCRAAGETIASGELCVTPAASGSRPATGRDDERTVPMTNCGDGRAATTAVAALTVRARAWNAGPVTAASVEPPAWPTDADGKNTAACRPRRPKPSPCCPRPPKPSPCCPTRTACRRPCATTCCRRTVVVQPQQRYTSIGCEIDGRKIDLRVRKNNYETRAVQQMITSEAEEFANRAMDVVNEMHGLITNTINAKKRPANELATDTSLITIRR